MMGLHPSLVQRSIALLIAPSDVDSRTEVVLPADHQIFREIFVGLFCVIIVNLQVWCNICSPLPYIERLQEGETWNFYRAYPQSYFPPLRVWEFYNFSISKILNFSNFPISIILRF